MANSNMNVTPADVLEQRRLRIEAATGATAFLTAWNTHRAYTPEGQKIAACWLKGLGVVFVDASRAIDGFMPTNLLLQDWASLREWTLQRYDHNEYNEYPPSDFISAEAWLEIRMVLLKTAMEVRDMK